MLSIGRRPMRKAVSLGLLFLFMLAGPAAAGSVRLVVMDGINLEHLERDRYSSIRFLIDHGALGLANANTAGSRNRDNAVFTLACGSRAFGPGAGAIFAQAEELEETTAAFVHARCTGVSAPAGAFVLPGIAAIASANAELMHRVPLGYLAETLRAGGKTAAALVNGDEQGNYREAAAIIADSDGVIAGGNLATALTPAPGLPFGRQSDLAGFSKAVLAHQAVDLLVIDLGDAIRAQDYSVRATPPKQAAFRQAALVQLDRFLGELLAIHQEDDLLLVVGLQADRALAREEGKLLAPIIAYGQGFAGLLTSATTRRPGLVASIDVAASILDYFQLYQPGAIYGQPFYSRPHPDAFGYLLGRERQLAHVYRLRPPLVTAFITAIILLIITSLAAQVFGWHRRGWLQTLLLMATATPLALLAVAPLAGSLLLTPAWLALALAAALGLRRLKPQKALGLLAAATALLIVADALAGAPLQQRSVLGYDAIAGARYYGIGNEYMGALLGSSLLALGPLLARDKRLAGLLLVGVGLVLALPAVGANFGGALAAFAGFTVAVTGFSLVWDKKKRPLAVAALALLTLTLVAVNLGSDRSHVGRFLAAIRADPQELGQTIMRKLAMNWRLIRWSQWSKAFAALFVGALWFILPRRRSLARRLGRHWPWVRGALAGALAALVFNDSGIVAAAMALLYMTLPLLYLWLSNSLATDSHSR